MKILILASLLVLIACVKKEESSSIVLSAPSTADYGVYSRCDADGGRSMKVQMYFNQKSINGTFTLHAGGNCHAGSTLAVQKDVYSYTNVGSQYTLTVESMTMTPIDITAVNLFNGDNPCSSEWFINTPKNMFGCEGYEDVSVGDTHKVNLYKDGTSLVMKEDGHKTKYDLVHAINYAPQGQTLANGGYNYYDGSRAVFLTLTSPNFTMKLYDETLHRYYVKTGTYTSANNETVFTTTSTTPNCSLNGAVTYKFYQSSSALVIDGLEGTDWLLEKATMTDSQFQNAFLNGSYSSACF